MQHRTSAAARAVLGLLTVASLTILLAAPIAAANATVSGTLSFNEKIALSPAAVAVITIVDQTAAADAGAIIGQQRIDAPGSVPIPFSVLYDAGAIETKHAYALFATIIDGENVWQSPSGTPVITGGPTSGVDLILPAEPSGLPEVTGAIAMPAGTQLSAAAVTIAALIKQETGTLVSRDVRPVSDPAALDFAIAVDPGLIDPAAAYVVKAAVVDGAAVWEDRQGETAIDGGQPVSGLTVTVSRVATDLPVATPPPTVEPTAGPTEEPTNEPTTEPTEAPTATPEPTPEPTEEPTPAPTATPTPSPSPLPSASASVEPSPSPITGPLTGTLTYAESHELSSEAFAAVALVRGTAQVSENTIVASEIYQDIGDVPVAFELAFDSEDIDPDEKYTVQATIVDGPDAWATSRGVEVLTNGAPSNVDLKLSYRPDLVKGEVTGQVTAVGLQPTSDAFAITVLVEVQTGDTLGIFVQDSNGALPIPFGIGYTLTEIDDQMDYVVQAAIEDGTDTTWQTVTGVPVITKGNPTSAVQVVVTEIVPLTPVATPTPIATAQPVEGGDQSGGTGALLTIVIIGAVVAVAAAVIAKMRNS